MYAFPVYLPKFSNREDFVLSVAIFDDMTGLPIDLTGVTLAVPGASFTSNAWTVTDGAILTTSATSITIPAFPNVGQLSALPLTVGLGLGILAGDPIKIVDTATGKNQMLGYVLSYASTTGALVVQIGMSFVLEIRKWKRNNLSGAGSSGYSPFYDIGIQDLSGPIISAGLGTGLSITDLGYVTINIPVKTFAQLNEFTYMCAMTMTNSVDTRQIFIAELPVQAGLVTQPAGTPNNPAWSSIF